MQATLADDPPEQLKKEYTINIYIYLTVIYFIVAVSFFAQNQFLTFSQMFFCPGDIKL